MCQVGSDSEHPATPVSGRSPVDGRQVVLPFRQYGVTTSAQYDRSTGAEPAAK